MKSLKSIFYLFLLVLVVSSCGKENIDERDVDVTDPDIENLEVNPLVSRSSLSGEDGLELDCITILYPFSMIDVESVQHDVANEDDLDALFSGGVVEIVDFVYPLNLEAENGDLSTAADGNELAESFAACLPSGGWEEGDFPAYLISYENSCYNLVYPLSVEKLDGTVVSIMDEDTFNAAIATEPVFFVFPIDLLHEDGTSVTINNIDEIFDALISCNGFETGDTTGWGWDTGFEYIGCYYVEFPLDVVLSNGDVVTVNDHMELCDLMLQGEIVSYAFPMTLIDEDGNVVVVSDEGELNELIDDCYDWNGGDGLFELLLLVEGSDIDSVGFGCYSITYPLQLELTDGSFLDLNADADIVQVVFSGRTDICCMVYPFEVTYIATGVDAIVEDFEDLIGLMEGC